MKKNLLFILACVYAFSLNAANINEGDNVGSDEYAYDEKLYTWIPFQDVVYGSNNIIGYIDLEETTTLTFRILLSGTNRSARYSFGNTYYLSTGTNDEIYEIKTHTFSKGRHRAEIYSGNRSNSTAVINIIKINGQPASQSQLILSAQR